jgi:hypothetical protein
MEEREIPPSHAVAEDSRLRSQLPLDPLKERFGRRPDFSRPCRLQTGTCRMETDIQLVSKSEMPTSGPAGRFGFKLQR